MHSLVECFFMKNSENNNTKKPRVLIAMSGGVDSSVAACLLAESEKYELVGIFMKFWEEADAAKHDGHVKFGELELANAAENKCCSVESFEGGRRIATKYNFPLYTLNFKDTFKEKVVDPFLRDYAAGLTPNPCVNCNKFVKFGELLKRAEELGCDYIATGHYAQIRKNDDGLYELFQGKDAGKDQSYFMYNFTQEVMKKVMFPLGGFQKDEVRSMAQERGLLMARKRDSQEICFYKEKDQYAFLARHLDLQEGDIVDQKGNVVGKHNGLPLYTLGQRKGINVGGIGPFYVVDLDYDTNTLHVSTDRNDPQLLKKELAIRDWNWLSGAQTLDNIDCSIRYHHREKASLKGLDENGNLQVEFENPQRAIMPGQSAVFYAGDQLLGGGIIV